MNDQDPWKVVGYLLPGGTGATVVTPVLWRHSQPKRFFLARDPEADTSWLKELPHGDDYTGLRLGGDVNYCPLDKPIDYSPFGVYVAQAPTRSVLFVSMQASQAEDFLNALEDHRLKDLERAQAVLEQKKSDR